MKVFFSIIVAFVFSVLCGQEDEGSTANNPYHLQTSPTKDDSQLQEDQAYKDRIVNQYLPNLEALWQGGKIAEDRYLKRKAVLRGQLALVDR